MAMPPHSPRPGAPQSWERLARCDAEQQQRFLAESLSILLADLLRSVLADSSPALPADELFVARYCELTTALADIEERRQADRGITRTGLAKRCVTWLKLLLSSPPHMHHSAALREFVDALNLFPALFDSEPSARSSDLAADPRPPPRRQHARSGHRPDRRLRAPRRPPLAGRRNGLTRPLPGLKIRSENLL